MKQQNYLNRTLRDAPADAEASSHQWMLRAGLIRQLSSGVYSYLPLGLKVLQRIQRIVREEMDHIGAQELLLPALHPAELWKQSGRWDIYGPELMSLEDRHGRSFVLGATHEEVITTLLKEEIHSYKKLPITLYQIQTKFRDERRPRFGLIRGREFIMKDAYSFNRTHEDLDKSYHFMHQAYQNIFSRCGLNYRTVMADSGAMGGKDTHEFMALADIGEDTIVHCKNCGYAANLEKAESISPKNSSTIKAIALKFDGKAAIALLRGDHELNETKMKNALGASSLELFSEVKTAQDLQTAVGSIGLISSSEIKLIADFSISGMVDAVAGRKERDIHLLYEVSSTDLAHATFMDLRSTEVGDLCKQCNNPLHFAKGIEIGHIFKLGTKYSERLGATFLDDKGVSTPMVMGCYGIGISRVLAAIVEQNHDDHGIVWPISMAPFSIHLLTMNIHDTYQMQLSEELYQRLLKEGYDVLWDNREERPGVKFNDSDILGIPLRITIGKKAVEDILEIKIRRSKVMNEFHLNDLLPFIKNLFQTGGIPYE
jgi:prolyl-tRNA synthetase